jgi:hypothetical protein
VLRLAWAPQPPQPAQALLPGEPLLPLPGEPLLPLSAEPLLPLSAEPLVPLPGKLLLLQRARTAATPAAGAS